MDTTVTRFSSDDPASASTGVSEGAPEGIPADGGAISAASGSETVSAGPSSGLSRAELRGRATGAGVLAFFGLGWSACGISSLAITPGRVLFGIAVVISVAFGFFGARMSRRAAQAPVAADVVTVAADVSLTTERRKTIGRGFGLVVLAEWIAIFIIAVILGISGHPEAIPALVALAVGVHFFPLARLFHVRAYWFTGSALCLVTVTTAVLAPLTSAPALWTLLPGFGSALTLYATCLYLLRSRTA